MNTNPDTPESTRRFVKYHLPVIVYAAGILAVSSIPNLRTPDLRVLAVDKLAHFLEYAVFAFLTFWSFYHIGRTPNLRRTLLVAALFVTVFALLDELHQHFIPGRQSDWLDFVVDVLGAFIILAVLGLYRYRHPPQDLLKLSGR